MTLLVPERTLLQPTYRHIPDTRVGDFGDEITDMMGLFGRELDAEQQQGVADHSSYDKHGKWVSLDGVEIEARQNGKTGGVTLPVTLFDLFELPPDRICWTAHRFVTALATFEDIMGSEEAPGLLERAPEYLSKIREVRRTKGKEGIYLKTGASLEFLARESEKSGRGLGGKRNVFDEALIISPGILGALVPTNSARPNPHSDYVSSAPFATSDHLWGLIKRGRYAKPGDRIVYREWCAPGGWGTNPCDLEDECPHDGRLGCRYPTCEMGLDCPHTLNAPDCAFDRRQYLQMANHTAGGRISWQYLEDERVSLAAIPREYGRERLGWGEERPLIDPATGVDLTRWSDLERSDMPKPTEHTPIVIAVDVPPDRSSTSIAVAWWHDLPDMPGETGRQVAAVMVTELPGTAGAVEAITTLMDTNDVRDLSLQSGGPAGSLIKPLDLVGADAWPAWQVHGLSPQEVGQAAGHWVDAMRNKTMRHLGQPELLRALQAAQLRKFGEAKTWAREDDTNLSWLFAATLALYRLYEQGDLGGPNVW